MSSMSLADYKRLYAKPRSKPKRRVSVKKERVVCEGEATLVQHLKTHRISFEQEYKFHPTRKWRADFLITGTKILIEVEGGIWSGGRHTRGKGYIGDMEKYNSAAMMGFTVLRFSTEQVKAGVAIKQIEQLVGDKN
ncbi:endonuclease domain-containing protein [Acinetobacter baumannii]|nr:endonuclease domain-containing protein [Acinetobacter baumannii]MDC4743231.1 endonuclease domain-containing protein [Acinetobacter baumannii]MDC5201712.1 endonuclease domain-containing protein [Acinetobacter baumannii]